MILRRLRLHPFAGTADREQVFGPGLNVILGPNEAGKTTLRNALWHALFVPTHLNKRERAEKVLPFLPLAGGDAIRVSVALETKGNVWELQKQWTEKGGQSELILPNGGVITDADGVEAELTALLVRKPGTWRHVLFATQGSTTSALGSILGGPAVDDLRDVLRTAGFETDGVSIESLGQGIEGQWKATFSRWDRELGRPEKNRGIQNPWKREVGSILEAFYRKEEAQRALDQAHAYYRELDAVTEKLNEAASRTQGLKAWVEDHGPAAADAGRRVSLEAELALARTQEKALRAVSQEWPVAIDHAQRLEKEALGLKEEIGALKEEQERADAWEAASQKRADLDQARELTTRIQEAREAVKNAPEVSEETLRRLETLDREGEQIRTRMEASQLKLTFTARKELDIEVERGLGEKEERTVAPEEPLETTAGARASLRHPDWSLEVRSGDIDIEAEEARFQEVRGESRDLLMALNAADLPSARQMGADYAGKTGRLNDLEERLRELLGEQTLDSLEEEVAAAGGGEKPERPASAVAEKKARAEASAQSASDGANEQRRKIQEWEDEYGSQEELLDQLLELRGRRGELEKEGGALRPLPEGFEDARAFLQEYERKEAMLHEAKDAYSDFRREKETLEVQAPEMEPAEATELLQEAEADFERALAHGRAMDRIKASFEDLRAEMDEGTLQPWLAHLSDVMAPLSDDRYRALDLDQGTFSLGDPGIEVPFSVLSMGTRASLALAVRLSMARWFLRDQEGFLVLDDPLVDLDPGRQQEAAALLGRFAQDKQVLLMTCHPSHAEILGGEVIEM